MGMCEKYGEGFFDLDYKHDKYGCGILSKKYKYGYQNGDFQTKNTDFGAKFG